jgi:hypothetical protein
MDVFGMDVHSTVSFPPPIAKLGKKKSGAIELEIKR